MISRYPRWLVCAALFALLLLVTAAHAQRSYFETLNDSGGALSASGTIAITQDAQGFIWLARTDGLWRYDGRNFIHWMEGGFSDPVHDVVQSRTREIFLRTFDSHGFFKTERGMEPLIGPDGTRATNLVHMAYDPGGRLWCVLGKALWRRERNGQWVVIPSVRFGDETPRRLSTLEDGIGLMTDRGAWALRNDAPGVHLLAAHDLFVMAGGGKDPIWISAHFCDNQSPRLWRYDGQISHPVACHGGRVMGMVYRHATLWHATDSSLNAYEPHGRVRVLNTELGLPSGGALFVDREDSLWMASFAGLLHFPEPDTWYWGHAEGLSKPFGYWIQHAAGRVWVSIWGNVLASIADDGSDLRAETEFEPQGRTCTDARDRLWASDRQQLWYSDGGAFHAVPLVTGPSGSLQRCLRDGDVLWMVTALGVYRLDANADAPQRVFATTPEDAFDVLWPGRDNSLWMAQRARVCQYEKSRDGSLSPLDCAVLRGVSADSDIAGVLSLTADHAWIGCNTCAIDFDGRNSRVLSSRNIVANARFLPARSGGFWMTGANMPLARIRPCMTCAAGYELLEKPGKWQGMPPNIDGFAVESPRGDVWVNSNGVYRIPAAARPRPHTPPNVVLVRARIDNNDKPLNEPLWVGLNEHSIALEFAALTYRDQSLLHLRSRLAGSEDWHELDRSTGSMRFVDLPPRRYRVEVQASLDGDHWSEPPTDVAFVVATPWYRSPFAYALFGILGIGAFTLAYRARMASVLRVERERTRIAMDLHDDLGSGLGSIGMLAVVAARADLSTDERQRVAAQIAQAAGMLGSGLRSLVWSMKSGRAGMSDLAMQLADHVRRLLPGPTPQPTIELPHEYPHGVVHPEVRRHLLLIALEALHNSVRHGCANRVKVHLGKDGQSWLLVIEDDGEGFDPESKSYGSGLESMRRRARLIDADLLIRTFPGAGTRIELRFMPFETHRMFMRLRKRDATDTVTK